MWKIKEFWNNWDIFSVVAHIFGIILTIAFTLFVIWFVVLKVKPLIIMYKLEKEEKYKVQIEKERKK